MIRHVADDLFQVGQVVTGAYGQEAVQVYVLLNDGEPVLIDCGSHLHRREIMRDLLAVLDGHTPGHIFLTHSELPHAGNLAAVAERWPHIHVLVSNVMLPYIEVLPVLPLAQITQVRPGTLLEFSQRTLTFVDALLKDQPGSQWIFDDRTGALFTGDGFGYYQEAGDDPLFSDEIPGGIQEPQFRGYHRTAFRFLRWIKPHRFSADLERLFHRYPVRIIAPIHGCAIRGDIDQHVHRLQAAIVNICAEYGQTAAAADEPAPQGQVEAP